MRMEALKRLLDALERHRGDPAVLDVIPIVRRIVVTPTKNHSRLRNRWIS